MLRHHSHGELHYFTMNSTSIIKNSKNGNLKSGNGGNKGVNGSINTSPSGTTASSETNDAETVAVILTESNNGCFKNEIQSLYAEIEKSRFFY